MSCLFSTAVVVCVETSGTILCISWFIISNRLGSFTYTPIRLGCDCKRLFWRHHSPDRVKNAANMNKHESISPMDVLYQVWLKLAQWFSRRKWKCEKFTTSTTTTTTTITTTTTDNGQIVIRKAHLSLRLRWAKIVQKIFCMCPVPIEFFFLKIIFTN